MKNIFKYFVILIIASFISCVGVPVRPASATTTGPRTIILDGRNVSEDVVGGFTSWFCYDFVYEEKGVLLEVGFFGDPVFEGIGYILYDGGYIGEFTSYQRVGLEHRWDWGPNGNDYSFVIKSDNTGLYYNFSNVKAGQSTRASDVFKCYRKN